MQPPELYEYLVNVLPYAPAKEPVANVRYCRLGRASAEALFSKLYDPGM